MPKTRPGALAASQALSAHIAAEVKRMMKTRGLLQRDIAERTDIDRTTVNKMLTGKLPISMANAALLAKALHVEVSALTANVGSAAKLTPTPSEGDSMLTTQAAPTPTAGRRAFVERHRSDLSEKEADFLFGATFPPHCDVPDDEDFWMSILIAYRAAKLRLGRP